MPQPALGRIRRTKPRHAAAAFDRGQEGRLLAADKRPGAFLHAQVQPEVAAHDRIAQISPLLAPLEGLANPLDGQRILGPDVEDPLGGAHGPRRDRQALDHAVGKRLEEHAIHEGPGVAFVAVANDELLPALGGTDLLPFDSRGKTGPAAAAEPAGFHLLDNPLGRPLRYGAPQGLKPLVPQVLVEIDGIDLAGELRGQSPLPSQEGTDRWIANVDGMPFDRIRRVVRNDLLQQPGHCMPDPPPQPLGLELREDDRANVFGVYLGEQFWGPVHGHDLHERRLVANAHAADALHGRASPRLGEDRTDRVVDLIAPLGLAAGAEPHANFAARLRRRRSGPRPIRRAVGELTLEIREHVANDTGRHVAVRDVVDLDHRGQGATAQAGHLLQREPAFAIRVVAVEQSQMPRQGILDQARTLGRDRPCHGRR